VGTVRVGLVAEEPGVLKCSTYLRMCARDTAPPMHVPTPVRWMRRHLPPLRTGGDRRARPSRRWSMANTPCPTRVCPSRPRSPGGGGGIDPSLTAGRGVGAFIRRVCIYVLKGSCYGVGVCFGSTSSRHSPPAGGTLNVCMSPVYRKTKTITIIITIIIVIVIVIIIIQKTPYHMTILDNGFCRPVGQNTVGKRRVGVGDEKKAKKAPPKSNISASPQA